MLQFALYVPSGGVQGVFFSGRPYFVLGTASEIEMRSSLALSVKMSILLFSPAWLIVLLAGTGLQETLICGLSIIAIQVSFDTN